MMLAFCSNTAKISIKSTGLEPPRVLHANPPAADAKLKLFPISSLPSFVFFFAVFHTEMDTPIIS